MIAGVFLRHYKTYQGMYFVPLCDDINNKYSMFIGNNGVGKSSILESLDVFFNNSQWNKNKMGKKDETFIAPLFLIKKEEFNKQFGGRKNLIQYVEFISEYFWNVNSSEHPNFKIDEIQKFFDYRDSLKKKYKEDEYYLILLGISYENKSEPYFITFNKSIEKHMEPEFKKFKTENLLDAIKDFYSYIYIPVQSSPSDILRIESQEIQKLMNSDILKTIDSILTDKKFNINKKNSSVIDYINISLNEYMDSVNKIIYEIDENYAFKVEGGYKKNLTAADVRRKILEAYFSIRTLKKDKKEIDELSSGEQRIAIIDIATSFLLNNKDADTNIILAIDEPENSLHISKAFNQFERLERLSKYHQIIVTTHWYGSLPIIESGNLHYISKEDKINISSCNINNYFFEKKEFPQDVIIKSFFELTTSILSSMRADKTNWIICEGVDDKIYLKHYLKDIKNLKIFSVGGCSKVIKLYKYLYIPLSENNDSKSIESKILCLIDTDDEIQALDIGIDSETRNKKLKIVRMQHNRDNRIELKKIQPNGYHRPTEIEDCLNPKILYKALNATILNKGDEDQKGAINKFKFNDNAQTSRIKGEDSIIYPITLEAMAVKDKIYSIIDNNYLKYCLAEQYVRQDDVDEYLPELFELIKKHFN